MRPPSPNNKNRSTSTTFKITRKSTSTTFKMALVIMEQYQRNQQMMLEKCMEMFMKQQEIQTKIQTKFLIDAIQHKNGRLNIDTTQIMNSLGKQNIVSKTRTDDRNAAAKTVKHVPRYWLDWVEKRKQNEQKRQEERANNGTTNVHNEYIDGVKN